MHSALKIDYGPWTPVDPLPDEPSEIDGFPELAQRVADLDSDPTHPQVVESSCPAIAYDVAHFITVMDRIHDSHMGHGRILQCVSPTDADAVVGKSRLLNRLMDTAPEIVTGPVRLGSQYWIGRDQKDASSKDASTLSESQFIDVLSADTFAPSAKPFCVGLFTSTGLLGTHGMWRIYLDLNPNSSLNPMPWHIWAVEPHHDAAVCEITSASQWVEFVLSHPDRNGDILAPDWKSAARRYDAVHMTLPAIAAAHGLYFRTEQGLVATGYWHIESTLWLRWRFRSVRLVEVVTRPA